MNGTQGRFLCIHGHFYQPPREDPFSGQILPEPGAAPYPNFNAKIAAECYRPNAVLGNFARISFDLGPTLAAWLEQHDRATYRRILAQERLHVQRTGCSNALAQVYGHAIMPLATEREKRIQVAWGLSDYQHRFRRPAAGMWLAETAADEATLEVLATYGVEFTVLAPWQAAEPVDVGEPYRVRLPSGRTISVFFFHGPLSGAVSFDPAATTNADQFAERLLAEASSGNDGENGQDRLLLIATDGELYGHHQPFREHFLAHLLEVSAPRAGFTPISLAAYLRDHPPRREVQLRAPGSWSCHHGVERWRAGCACTPGDGSWKGHLRRALERLAARLDELFAEEGRGLLADPWRAEEEYIAVKLGVESGTAFWRRHADGERTPERRRRALELLEGQYHRHLMFVSCAFFFEDLDRLEPRIALAQALRAIALAPPAQRGELLATFRADLASARSWRTGRSGADLLDELAARRSGGRAAPRRGRQLADIA